MLIGISGTLASGKTAVAHYLSYQGFKLISFQNAIDDSFDGSSTPGSQDLESSTASLALSEPLSPNPLSSEPSSTKVLSSEISSEPQSLPKRSQRADSRPESPLTSSSEYASLEVFKHFDDLTELLEFVTFNWRENYVISHINDMEMLVALQKRPFFLHISIDAPMNLRFKRWHHRFKSLANSHQKDEYTFEQFVFRNDELLFSVRNPLIEINNQAQVKIINTSGSIKELYVKLSELNLLDSSRLRPTWDSYFMRLADLAALRSNCMKRRVGAVIVHENRVIATGYNGTPRHLTNCNEGGCDRCNKGSVGGTSLLTCLCLHAEENALLEAGRDRIRGEAVLYCNTCPCLTCSIKIVQSGIKEVVYAQSYFMDSLSHKVMSEANIILRQFQPPTEGIFI